jgi:TPR repeat protein
VNQGQLYLHVAGIAKDETKAVALFDQACKMNSGPGCMYAAAVYANGLGSVTMDEPKALEYLKRACDLGIRDACGSAPP